MGGEFVKIICIRLVESLGWIVMSGMYSVVHLFSLTVGWLVITAKVVSSLVLVWSALMFYK